MIPLVISFIPFKVCPLFISSLPIYFCIFPSSILARPRSTCWLPLTDLWSSWWLLDCRVSWAFEESHNFGNRCSSFVYFIILRRLSYINRLLKCMVNKSFKNILIDNYMKCSIILRSHYPYSSSARFSNMNCCLLLPHHSFKHDLFVQIRLYFYTCSISIWVLSLFY